jgi:nifR3 family TIM-barrel protein
MRIGPIKIKNPFILAPLAGFTDIAFRMLCREYGAGFCVSEMISCHGLVYRQEKTLQMLQSHPSEQPISMQLFGSEPEIMGEAAAVLSDFPVDIIDINMGCPVKKVVKKGAGAALMKTPDLAAGIIRKVCDNTKLPVTVKIRSGWSHQNINAPQFALMAQDHGASAITVHARTWSDGFSGKPDWDVIAAVKKAVSIPVIGNGDVSCREDGLKMMQKTGCDAVMIGRGAIGAPWVFGNNFSSPSVSFRLKALNRHLQLIEQFFPAETVLAKTKNQAGRYFKGVHSGASIRQKIYETKSFAELKNFILANCSETELSKPAERSGL